MNEENEWSRDLKMVKFAGSCGKNGIEEVEQALSLTNARKAARPSEVTSELLKVSEKE